MLEKNELNSSAILSKAISKLIEAISTAPEGPSGLENIYNEALNRLHDSLDIERSSILLFDPDGVMRFKAWRGISDQYRKAVEGHSPWSPNDTDATPVIVTDILQDKELAPYIPIFQAEDIRALAFIPLMYRRKVIGKFMLYARVPCDFADKIAEASTIAQLVAYAVIKKKIEDKLEILLAIETEARKGAEKSIQQRDDFLSIASHELKTPLTPIKMNFQMANRYLKSIISENPRAEIMLKIFESTNEQFERFMNLVENLLDVSRITAERLILNKESFNLSELTHSIIDKYKTEFNNLNYKVTEKIEDEVNGSWDKTRVEQILTNLISNAIKYGLGNPIEIELYQEKKTKNAVFRIKDQGIGIEKENLDKIFNRFERAAPINNFGGLGLGLFISKNLAFAHGGSITVQSAPDEGSTFTLTLPIIKN